MWVVFHVGCSSSGLFFMRVVLHVVGIHVARTHLRDVNDVLVPSTRGHTAGFHVRVIHVVW